MTTRNYQPLQMHRISYTDLSENQISRALRGTNDGPSSQSPFSVTLAGKSLKIITDDGPVLEYDFRNARELSLSVDGESAVNASYGALESKQLVVVSHMVPGTQRGYNLVIDQDTNLATVFEIYFSGYVPDTIASREAAGQPPFDFPNGNKHREVQRHVYFGYVDDGGEVSTARHFYTNRLEGKGVYWKQDTDIETLEMYTSILYANFIELTRFGGEMTVCAPSDYIMINDHQFVYSRIECEFSGIYTMHVIDLFDMSQAGVRLGFNEQDDLEYYMYTGEGEITGQIATFEVFGDNSKERGPRRVYRPLDTFPVMTDDEVSDQVINHAHAFGDGAGSGASGMGGYKGELITHFAGKQLTARMDNDQMVIEYDFTDEKQLKWRYEGDSNWREAWYEMYEPDEELFFFAHLLDEEFPRSCAMVALDMRNGLSTIVKGTTGTPFRNNETTPTYMFGVLEMDGITAPTYKRHGWTTEMVGEAVTWNYSPSPQPGTPGLTSMHLYATPSTYSWIIFQPDGSGGLQWSSPGWYSKLRDGVYIMAWVEEACNGTLGVICFNKKTMHDAGFGYHVGPNGLSLSVIGAQARHAGTYDIGKYLEMNT